MIDGVAILQDLGYPIRGQVDRALMGRRSSVDAVGRARVVNDLHWADGTTTAAGLEVNVFKPTSTENAWRRDVVVVVINDTPRRLAPSDIEPLDVEARKQVEIAFRPPREEEEKARPEADEKWLAAFFGAWNEVPDDVWALEQCRFWDLGLVGQILMSRKPKGMGPGFKTYRLLHNWLKSGSSRASEWAAEQREARR